MLLLILLLLLNTIHNPILFFQIMKHHLFLVDRLEFRRRIHFTPIVSSVKTVKHKSKNRKKTGQTDADICQDRKKFVDGRGEGDRHWFGGIVDGFIEFFVEEFIIVVVIRS